MASSPDAAGEARTALVTGGASGIGLACAIRLVHEGWHVVVADADAGALAALADAGLGPGDRVTGVRVDVTDEAAVAAAIDAIPATRALRGVVNCAGIARSAPFVETPVATLRAILDVNLVGTYIVCQAAVRAMTRGGAIVNISSGSGLRANAGRAAYGASKAAVELLSKVMAVELATRGIRVNTVAPGPIETPLVARVHTPAFRAAALSTVPMQRYGRPDDVAQAVCFLLDDARAGYVTGETLCVDGGFLAAGAFERAGPG